VPGICSSPVAAVGGSRRDIVSREAQVVVVIVSPVQVRQRRE
jgi:hypothetical protein